jgi:hypothetical protein
VPYSHPDPAVRQTRFETANRTAARLMREGRHIFSPISHTHPIALAGTLPLDWTYWQAYDAALLRCCIRLLVIKLEGWLESVGVQGEIKLARELGLEIVYLEPEAA